MCLAHNALARRKRLADGSLCVMQVDGSGRLGFVVFIMFVVVKPSASNPPCAAFNRTPSK